MFEAERRLRRLAGGPFPAFAGSGASGLGLPRRDFATSALKLGAKGKVSVTMNGRDVASKAERSGERGVGGAT